MEPSNQIKNKFLKLISIKLENYFMHFKKKIFKNFFEEHQGKVSIKWELYLNEYERILFPLKKKSINVLEVGILNGGSLEILGQYFSQANLIIGCDINNACENLNFSDKKIKIIIGDVLQDITYSNITELTHQFDLIIDDGSHRSGDVICTFTKYFPLLSEGGVYVVEDLHASYWSDYDGGLFDPLSTVAFIKKLIDVTQFQSWGNELSVDNFMADFDSFFQVPVDWEFLLTIHSIEIINSMCVIKKSPKELNQLGKLRLAGQEENVICVSANQIMNKTLQPVNQSNNILSSVNLKDFSITHAIAISQDLKK